MGDSDVTLVALSYLGQGDPVWLIRPFTRKIVASSVCWNAKRVRALRSQA